MIKIFGVGNSYTEDAFTWLNDICAGGGIEIKTVTPFIGGCTFKRHLGHIKSGEANYDLILNGKNTGKKISFIDALKMEDWDIITFNQGSVQSGRPNSYYPYINQMKDLIMQYAPNAKMFVYQTWGYETDSTHPYYYVYHNNQKEMWSRARDAYHLASRLIDAPIIPVGDVIQHLRENVSEFDYQNGGMSLNRDGFHLTEIYGRYAAGLTIYASVFGGDVFKNDFVPELPNHITDTAIIDKIKNSVFEITSQQTEENDD